MVEERLVAAPYYSDAPLLYYRTDLLAANGFDAPPGTWEELQDMAATIQQAERAKGNSGFYGYVFQGAAYEGLTCNALEWQVAETGMSFLSQQGVVTLNTPEVRTLFENATKMVTELCPPGVLTYKEEESRLVFHQGNAAFMRNWPYAYTLGSSEGSPIAGRFAVGPLPSGASQSAAVLGGWGLGVSRYSRNKDEAKQFIAFVSTREAQRRRAMEGGYLATRPDVFADPEVRQQVPYFAMMEEILADPVVRPAVPSGRSYNEVSSAYFSAVHLILSKDSSAQRALADAEARIQRILAR
jgi:trehalose/maltose transport system substrate-binding protein